VVPGFDVIVSWSGNDADLGGKLFILYYEIPIFSNQHAHQHPRFIQTQAVYFIDNEQ
jgi:hypothetical protein